MARTIRGRVHGKTIELDKDPGVAEGQEVEVQVRLFSGSSRQPGEGLLRTEGALADDTEWDSIMEDIYQDRKRDRRPQAADLTPTTHNTVDSRNIPGLRLDDWLTP